MTPVSKTQIVPDSSINCKKLLLFVFFRGIGGVCRCGGGVGLHFPPLDPQKATEDLRGKVKCPCNRYNTRCIISPQTCFSLSPPLKDPSTFFFFFFFIQCSASFWLFELFSTLSTSSSSPYLGFWNKNKIEKSHLTFSLFFFFPFFSFPSRVQPWKMRIKANCLRIFFPPLSLLDLFLVSLTGR